MAGAATSAPGRTAGAWPACSHAMGAASSWGRHEDPDLQRRRHSRPRPRRACRSLQRAGAGHRRGARPRAERHVALAHAPPAAPGHAAPGRRVSTGRHAHRLRHAGARGVDAEKPDFVISGINHGQNMGEDVFYSGTVAAAMEGLVAGIPSIAVSYAGSDLDMLETHKDGLRSLLQRIVEVKDFPKETLLNINLPALPGDQVKGVKVTHLGSRVFSEEIALMKDPWGKEIYWIGGGRITWTGGTESDFRATGDGYISVTALHMDMTNYKLIEVVRKWLPGD